MKKIISAIFVLFILLDSCNNEKNNSNTSSDSTNKNVLPTIGEGTAVISTSDYIKMVNSKPIVLVDFGASWCVYCKKLAPLLDDLVSTMPGKFLLVKSDSDRDSDLADSLSITSLPTLMLYKKGNLIWRNEGFIDEDAIAEKISAAEKN